MTARNLTIALVHLELFGPEDQIIEMAHMHEVEGITSALESLGHHVIQVPDMKSLLQNLVTEKHREWSLVFNISRGLHGTAQEAQVPGILEAYQIPFTFSDAATLALCQDKWKTKIMLEHYKIPTAPFATVRNEEAVFSQFPGQEAIERSHHAKSLSSYPLFVKPNGEGFSKGIVPSSRAQSPEELESAIKILRQKFPQQDILIESYLPGQELSVGILGTGRQARVIGVAKYIWKQAKTQSPHRQIDFYLHGKSNVLNGTVEQVLVNMNDPSIKEVSEIGLRAWNALRCQDGGRVDIRLDGESKPHVLEVNPIPGLWMGRSIYPEVAQENGISFPKLLKSIVESALERTEITRRTHQ